MVARDDGAAALPCYFAQVRERDVMERAVSKRFNWCGLTSWACGLGHIFVWLFGER